MKPPAEGIELLRYAVRLFDNCRESFNMRYSARDLLKIAAATRHITWDFAPDQWDARQVRELLEHGSLPVWVELDGNVVPTYMDGTVAKEGVTIEAWAAEMARTDREACALAGTDMGPDWTGEHTTALGDHLGRNPTAEERERAARAYASAAAREARRVVINRWDVPPECQGQIVEVAYGLDGDTAWRRSRDRSDGSIRYARADASVELDVEWSPWNAEPIGLDWKPCPDAYEDAYEDETALAAHEGGT